MTPNRMSAMIGLALVIGTSGAPMAQTATPGPTIISRGVSFAERFDVSPPLSDLAQRRPTVESRGNPDRDRPTGLEGPFGPQDVHASREDPLRQEKAGPGEIPAPSGGFNAFTNGAFPPDPNGAVGPNHFVVMANSVYAVYDKTGALLAGPANINTIWSGFGGACENENAGDPVVLYDRQTDRWLLTQFTAAGPTFFNCVALSQTSNPVGPYFRWAFSTGTNFPDYPKYGVWSDAYYISTREFVMGGATFAGVGAYALNRTQMVVGNPSPQMISFLAAPGATPYTVGDGLLPSNLDGSRLPPAGTPNFYIGSQDDGGPYGAPSDALNIFKFHVDFANPGLSSFTGPTVLPVGAFDSILDACGGTRDCIPQPGTAQKIDHLGYRQRPLHRAAYRNFGTYEAIVTNQSVEAAAGISGIRWWEIRSPNSGPALFQEGTYAPGDGVHRWMGSVAQDSQGNMALGFSVSNAAVFPGVRYTGRLVGDALGTLPQGEGVFVNGAGSQLGGNRWGDYTAMTIDPVDDCTFWYVNEYLQANGGTKTLRVGAFKYPNCVAPPPPIIGSPVFVLSAFGVGAGGWSSNDLYPRVVADVDGDRKVDIVGFGQNGVYVSLATGVGGFASPQLVLSAFGIGAGGWSSNDAYPRVLADVNGDGKADIVGFGYNGVYVSLATGGGNFAPPALVLSAFGVGAGGWTSNDTYPRVLADVNGDGKADIVGFGFPRA
jgi:FG-GAP-like repeat